MQKAATGMREKEITSMRWIDREGWRRKNKIKTSGTEICENIDSLCVRYYYTYYYIGKNPEIMMTNFTWDNSFAKGVSTC